MNKLLWSIPGVSIYLYGSAILYQFGYLGFFGVPGSFIKASPVENTAYAYLLLQLLYTLLGLVRWWQWLLGFVAIGLVVMFSRNPKKIAGTTVTVVALLLLVNVINLGSLVAGATEEFYVPSQQCAKFNNSRYLIPQISENKIVLVKLTEDNKLVGGFRVEDIEGCEIELKKIGNIYK